MWYEFRAWNAETQYGWTTNNDVAAACLVELNRDRREENLYEIVTVSECGLDPSALMFDDDTTVDAFTSEVTP